MWKRGANFQIGGGMLCESFNQVVQVHCWYRVPLFPHKTFQGKSGVWHVFCILNSHRYTQVSTFWILRRYELPPISPTYTYKTQNSFKSIEILLIDYLCDLFSCKHRGGFEMTREGSLFEEISACTKTKSCRPFLPRTLRSIFYILRTTVRVRCFLQEAIVGDSWKPLEKKTLKSLHKI